MSKYTRILLAGSLSDLVADLATLQSNFGTDSYFPQHNNPYKKVVTPATYTEAGEIYKEAVMSKDYYCNVILPIEHDFDLSNLKTQQK